jgi:multiple sugar transport system permease protein
VYPSITSLWYSVHEVSAANFFSPKFVGLSNYHRMLVDPDFRTALMNTSSFVIASLSIEFVIGLGLAMLFSANFRGKAVLSSMLLTPIIIAPSLTGYMFTIMLNGTTGVFPLLLKKLGIEVWFLGNRNLVLFTMILIDAWKWTPFMFLILYAGMRSLPEEPYEAAMVDGATKWIILRRITLPMLAPVATVALVFRFMDAWKVFDYIFILTDGGPGTATLTLSIYIYRAYRASSYGMAAAQAFVIAMASFFIARLLVRYLYGAGRQT